MLGIHINWTVPRKIHSDHLKRFTGNDVPLLGEWDLLIALLSVAQWRKKNGNCTLFTDSDGAKTFESLGILDLWSDVDTQTLDSIDTTRFDPRFFWCTAKFAAFKQQEKPFAYVDLDLIAWQKIEPQNQALRFLHWESTLNSEYDNGHALQTPEGYTPPATWSTKRDKAFNVACLYFGDMDFKELYCDHALSFMDGHKVQARDKASLKNLSGFSPEILYVEQTLLHILAEDEGIEYSPFIDAIYDAGRYDFIKDDPNLGRWPYQWPDPKNRFTHLWMYKHAVRNIPMVKAEYVRKLLQCAVDQFPEHIDRLRKIPQLSHYWEDPLFKHIVADETQTV